MIPQTETIKPQRAYLGPQTFILLEKKIHDLFTVSKNVRCFLDIPIFSESGAKNLSRYAPATVIWL